MSTPDAPPATDSTTVPDMYHIAVKHASGTYNITIDRQGTIGMLKHQISLLTKVDSDNQKLIVAKLKHKFDNTTVLSTVLDSTGDGNTSDRPVKIMLIGTPSAQLQMMYDFDTAKSAMNDSIIDDLDNAHPDSLYNDAQSNQLLSNARVQAKLNAAIKATTLNMMNPSRPGKRLLVLDIDYTVYDMKSAVTDFNILKRPHTDYMLTTLYQYYDIAFWSQTNWRFVEMKLTELGILTHHSYKVMFVLDKTCMFRVETVRKEELYKHYVKPLAVIWSHLPQYNATNTLHVDDLTRNFALNVQNGIQCIAYKNCAVTHRTDNELMLLTRYLQYVATSTNDVTTMDHTQWKMNLMKLAPTQ